MRFLIDDNMAAMSEAEFEQCLASVSDQRREKVMRYKFQSGREQSLRAYMLLQRLLKEEHGIIEPPIFRELENGKPVIIGHEDIFFNLSHCKAAVACAIADSPVGIDVECTERKMSDSLMEYVFSDREIQMIKDGSISWTALWTMKESLVKKTGIGIEGKEQLRPLLNDYHNGLSEYTFITEENTEKEYVMSLCHSKN